MKFTRRNFLATSVGASCLATTRYVSAAPERSAGQRLFYRRPATRWEEALPIGNGRLGAMVFGRVAQERLQLNEETLWSGAPYIPDNPDALQALPEVRRLIDAGKYAEATALASAKVMAKPLQQMSYGTLGDVLLDFKGTSTPQEYERSLDLETARSVVEYVSKGSRHCREAFASAPHQVIVLRLESRGAPLEFLLRYRGPRKAKYTSPAYQGVATTLVESAAVDWLFTETDIVLGGVTSAFDAPGCVLLTGSNEAGPDTPAGLRFALRLKLVCDGSISESGTGLQVRGAQNATLLIAGATSYVNYRDVSADPVAIVRARTDAAAVIPYATLKRKHVGEYRRYFDSASIVLQGSGKSPAHELPTDERIVAASGADDPGLAALYFQYARYLMISSSRPGCQPANLQGIWNEGTNPPWGSKYTININTEMNYWPADAAGLGECVEPLIRLVEDLSVTGARTAKTMYGARGWVAHHNTDLWRATAPIDGPFWGLWPCGGAWLCNSLWDHYDYSRDAGVLERIYPLMQGASQFFLDTLVEDPGGRGLVTSPSLSPENAHPFGSSLCAGPAMDRQIIRDLFAHTAEAARNLGRDSEFAETLVKTASRIAGDTIGKQGQLQEWLDDWDGAAPEPHHRHVSHLYAVYPSAQINVRDTPALVEAAKVSLRQRGDLATGWGTAWRLCLWARMGDAEHAHSVLKSLLGPQRTYPNMFDAHPPFQIDGNFGGAAGIMEMLVQSWGGEIRLLPALPAAWSAGEVRGIRLRGALRLDMRWSKNELRHFELNGTPGTSARLRYGARTFQAVLNAQGRHRADAQADGLTSR